MRCDAGRRFVWSDEPAVFAVLHEIRRAAGSCRDHRQAEGEGLEIDQPEAFVRRRPGEQVRRSKEFRELAGFEMIPHPDTAREHVTGYFRFRGIGRAAHGQLAFGDLARRLDQFENPFAAREPAKEHHLQRPGFLRSPRDFDPVRQIFGKRASTERVPARCGHRRRNGAPPEFECPVPAPPAGCEDALNSPQERPLGGGESGPFFRFPFGFVATEVVDHRDPRCFARAIGNPVEQFVLDQDIGFRNFAGRDDDLMP